MNTYKNNKNGNTYRLLETVEKDGKIYYKLETVNKLTGKKLVSLFLESTVKSELFTEITETAKTKKKIEIVSKCNKETTAEKINTFAEILLETVENETDYTIKREDAKANKFLLVYVNPINKKARNIAELFIKVRANTMDTFIREEYIAKSLKYDEELAKIHKEHNYNFWIEYSVKNEKQLILETVTTLISNHKKTITA